MLNDLSLSKGAVIKYDWEGGRRNLNFCAKYFIPHKEKILYVHTLATFLFCFIPQFSSKKSRCMSLPSSLYNLMMNHTLFCTSMKRKEQVFSCVMELSKSAVTCVHWVLTHFSIQIWYFHVS